MIVSDAEFVQPHDIGMLDAFSDLHSCRKRSNDWSRPTRRAVTA
jgi:hypothetical protein